MNNILQSKILVVSFWWRSIYNLVIQKLQSEMCNEFILVKTKNNCCVFRFFTFWIQTVCLCEKERAALFCPRHVVMPVFTLIFKSHFLKYAEFQFCRRKLSRFSRMDFEYKTLYRVRQTTRIGLISIYTVL